MNPYINKKIIKCIDGNKYFTDDYITSEEPMEIRLSDGKNTEPVSVIMRTPVDDFPLAVGFLFDEGMLKIKDFQGVNYDYGAKINEKNNIVIVSVNKIDYDLTNQRNFYVNSSCGVCGKTNIENVFIKNSKFVKIKDRVEHNLISLLPKKMRENQEIFRYTGGIHAAAIFDYNGNLISISEDIGRHNAVDKSIGKLLLNGISRMEDTIMQVSGRASFEIVQKAAMFGISIISSVSAPSSLAVELADTFNITLISFARDNKFNIYTHDERIL